MRKSKTRKGRTGHISKPHAPHAKKKAFKGLDNMRELDTFLAKTKIFQDVLGISQESLSSLYELSLVFLQTGRTDDAKLAFLFLTKLNPFASDFWVGLGVCHLQQEEFQSAFDAFIMAHSMDPSRYDCYAYAIEASVEMKNYRQAAALLKLAVAYAKRHPNMPQSSIILSEAPRIFQEIEIEQSS